MDLSEGLRLNFKLHIGVWTLIQNSSDCYSRVLLIKGEVESEESQIIYTRAPGAKHRKHLVESKLQTFNCQSFIIFNFTYNAHNIIWLISTSIQRTGNKKQNTLINLMRQSDSLPCDFQDVKLLTNDKRQ